MATYCSRTDEHYTELVEFHNDIKANNRQVEILAFPCNQFGQEPDEPAEIKRFAKLKGVQFRMMEKIDVNGKNAHIVYKWMKNLAGPYKIQWNFGTYFAIDEEGDVEEYSDVTPLQLNKELFYWIEEEEEL